MMIVFRSMSLLIKTQGSGQENSLREEITSQKTVVCSNPKILLWVLTSGSMDISTISLTVMILPRSGMLKTPPGREYDQSSLYFEYYTMAYQIDLWTS
jgi:hypothetical protein